MPNAPAALRNSGRRRTDIDAARRITLGRGRSGSEETRRRRSVPFATLLVATIVMSATPARAATASPADARWRVIERYDTHGSFVFSWFSDISCLSDTFCIAVGAGTYDGSTDIALAMRWNGSTWERLGTPDLPTADLNAVACITTTDCTAVGEGEGDGYLALAEHWDGRSWSLVDLPVPGDEVEGSLTAISCVAADSCVAVGALWTDRFRQRTLAERWDGSAWVVDRTPNPFGYRDSVLSGVACTAATSCIAVGWSSDRQGPHARALIGRWNGSTWSLERLRNATSTIYLRAVSCSGPDACTAVGDGDFLAPRIVRWNGIRWTLQTPAAKGFRTRLFGVSCPAVDFCVAVGRHDYPRNRPIAERRDGSRWTVDRIGQARHVGLGAVTCLHVSRCLATGSYDQRYISEALVARYEA
jgi:hypothetical protein